MFLPVIQVNNFLDDEWNDDFAEFDDLFANDTEMEDVFDRGRGRDVRRGQVLPPHLTSPLSLIKYEQ